MDSAKYNAILNKWKEERKDKWLEINNGRKNEENIKNNEQKTNKRNKEKNFILFFNEFKEII